MALDRQETDHLKQEGAQLAGSVWGHGGTGGQETSEKFSEGYAEDYRVQELDQGTALYY